MTLEEITDRVEHGGCPFTGRYYNCARCKFKPDKTECRGGSRMFHVHLCITQPLTHMRGGWEKLLQYFNRKDRNNAQEQIARLLQFGVESIPISEECDFSHFCFKHGCVGHAVASEAK